MSHERLRHALLGLGGVLMTAASLWVAVTPGGLATRFVGAFGVLFFGLGTWLAFRGAVTGVPLAKRAGGDAGLQHLVLPAALLFTLPAALKLWVCVPLLAGWGVLWPHYDDRRLRLAAPIFAGVLAVVQAVGFGIGAVAAIRDARDTRDAVLAVPFVALVVLLDARLFWEARKRLGTAS